MLVYLKYIYWECGTQTSYSLVNIFAATESNFSAAKYIYVFCYRILRIFIKNTFLLRMNLWVLVY